MRRGEEEKTGGGLEPEGETETGNPSLMERGGGGVPDTVMVKAATSGCRQSEAPGEEGEEIKSAKRKIIRVESEETQDYVREASDMDQEEAEEISFVPSAISVPQKPLF